MLALAEVRHPVEALALVGTHQEMLRGADLVAGLWVELQAELPAVALV